MKLLGRFEIIEQIGAGGMGVVYRARDPRLARTVALKVLSPALADDRIARERQLREARAAAALNHPNIATVYEIVAIDGAHVIVMEHIDGDTLHDRVRREPPPLARALDWMIEITDAVATAHDARVIHRDLKSTNIMITRTERAKVLDFGVARRIGADDVAGATRLSSAGDIFGTVGYIAPEVLLGGQATARSDVFSLGVILYEALTGRQPFEAGGPIQTMYRVATQDAPSLRVLRPDASEELDAIVQRALVREPPGRYATAHDMLADLRSVRDGERGRVQARPAGPPSNIPAPTSRFIGREKELDDLAARLAANRLLTITGPGGAGKTRASVELARRVASDFPDGTFLIELAPLDDASRIPIAIAHSLGLREDPTVPLMDTIADYVGEKRMLLVLDNCEHLVNTVAGIAVQMLESSPNLTLVATSQERLGVPGEVVWQIPTLSLPPTDVSDPNQLARYEAIRLFVDRATRVKTGFALDANNAAAVTEICRKLDGIPLAIELAAARVRMLTPPMLLDRLEDRFRYLTDGSRTSPPRQQTLRATVEWSIDLLDNCERNMFADLSVFSGGMNLDAIEGLCAGRPSHDEEIFDVLGRLVDKSLVRVVQETRGEPRYYMLETLRAYGREMLRKSGQYRLIHDRHAALFLGFVEAAEPELAGPNQVEWFDRLERDAHNGRAMLDWFLNSGDYDSALRVAAAVWRFWHVRGYLRSGRELLARVLTETNEPTPTRARALLGAGVLATDQGDYDAAREHFEECLAIHRAHHNQTGISQVLNNLGVATRDQGRYDEARRYLGEALEISREIGDRPGLASSLMALGITEHREGRCEEARALFQEAQEIRMSLNDQRGIAALFAHLGSVAFDMGDIDTADAQLNRALTMFEELGNKRGLVFARMYAGGVARQRGDLGGARECFVQCLMMARDLGDKQHIVQALERLAALAAARRNFDRALELEGAASALREAFGAPRTPLEQRMLERELAPAAAVMRESGMRRTRAAGRARLLDAVIDLALEEDTA